MATAEGLERRPSGRRPRPERERTTPEAAGGEEAPARRVGLGDPAEAPVVVVACALRPVADLVAEELRGVAETRLVSVDRPGIDRRLRSLRPSAVVVDHDAVAAAASEYGRAASVPLIKVSLRGSVLKVLSRGLWIETPAYSRPTKVRDVLARRDVPARKGRWHS